MTLAWRIERAQKVYVLQGRASMVGGSPIDWRRLDQMGQEVEPRGEMRVTPQGTATYTLAAVGQGGRRARSVTVEVMAEKPQRREPKIWYDDWDRFFRPGWQVPRDERLWQQIRCAATGPQITLSARPRAVFTDEEATLTWELTCSNCAQMSDAGSHTTLVEDLTRRSGTRATFGEGWGSLPPACSLNMIGETQVGALEGPGHYDWNIFAEGSQGGASSATVRVGFMPRPLFDACNADRHSAIEGALKDVYRRILDGCIRDDAGLDDAIAAFRDGWLNRAAFWARLRDELENIHLVTFRCNDTTDEEWRGGHWEEYTNVIDLDWSPNHGPRLHYVILHELIHKAGFHGDLEPHYTPDFIEAQAHNLASACS